eukprot:2889034-Rhodomonas_salina.1
MPGSESALYICALYICALYICALPCLGGRMRSDTLVCLLSCYAIAVQCPVLTSAMLLHLRYARSGTDIGYAATRR